MSIRIIEEKYINLQLDGKCRFRERFTQLKLR